MEKDDVNYWIDVILGISFLVVSVTGIIKLREVMNYLGLEWQSSLIQVFSKIHDWSGIILILFVLLHLILHREWIAVKTKELLKIEDKNKKLEKENL